MATLGYRCTQENGLSFELLVDGSPLGMLVGSRDTAFPYRLVEDGLPRWPLHSERDDPHIRIVCVCGCGEYGCSHTQCRVVLVGDEVVFNEFAFDVSTEGSRKEFRFPAADYNAVCNEVSSRAQGQRTRDQAARA
jgi:hypothetical protein